LTAKASGSARVDNTAKLFKSHFEESVQFEEHAERELMLESSHVEAFQAPDVQQVRKSRTAHDA